VKDLNISHKESEIHKRVEGLLREMCDVHYGQLERFADHRLASLNLHSAAGADLFHEAVQSVLTGLHQGPEGRHPRSKDLADLATFVEYFRNAIKSVVKGVARRENRHAWVQLDACVPGSPNSSEDVVPELQVPAPVGPDQDAAIADLGAELFRRLRTRAPEHLRPLIEAWETDFVWADAIPLSGAHRQYRAELRRLARQILTEIDPGYRAARVSPGFPAPAPPSGEIS
jgi:hypothetical protein